MRLGPYVNVLLDYGREYPEYLLFRRGKRAGFLIDDA